MPTTHLRITIILTMLACITPLLAAPKEKQTQNPAIVFMVAGQSNAGGCGVYSPEMHKELGREEARPLVPGTTAAEVGLPTDAAAYTHSYIWMSKTGFERLDPMVNTRPDEPGNRLQSPLFQPLDVIPPGLDFRPGLEEMLRHEELGAVELGLHQA
jgi:hypothetical protein